MTSRERIQAAIAREPLDRIPMLEIGFWDEAIRRFREEGMPESYVFQPSIWGGGSYCAEHTVEDYLGLDRIAVLAYDGTLRLPAETLEETEEFTVVRNSDGLLNKQFRNVTAPPLCLDNLIKTEADWLLYKELLAADDSRILPGMEQCLQTAREKGIYTVVKPEEGCQYALYLLGDEHCLEAMALEPDWVEDIIATYTERQLEMLELLLGKGYQFDAMWVFSDLCYKNGMLFSPAFYRERVLPYHQRLFGFCHAHGLQVIYHSDGYLKELLPLLIEAGIDCMQPLEARCGNDVRSYKKLYGDKIAFMGNINSDVLATGDPEQIRTEVREKVLIAKKGGGYLYHSDHSIPPTVSLESYRLALETAREFGRYDHCIR